MNKCVILLPYFGKFPVYFQLFLNSCKHNADYTWMIFTDDNTDYEYPQNVIVKKMSFEEVKVLIQSKFDFAISLEYPYKLCDYRPAYGYIFEKWIKGYEFWGHCDCDVIFGKLSNFIGQDLFDKYDKIFTQGHLTLYKNDDANNLRFKEKFKGKELYKEVFQINKNMNFDEIWCNSDHSIHSIYDSAGAKTLFKDISANIYMYSFKFQLSNITKFEYKYDDYSQKKIKNCLFVWNDGVLGYYIKNRGRLEFIEVPYMHFQKRKMKMKTSPNVNYYKIIPNSFEEIEIQKTEITSDNFDKIKKYHFDVNWYKWYIDLRVKRIKDKILDYFRKR